MGSVSAFGRSLPRYVQIRHSSDCVEGRGAAEQRDTGRRNLSAIFRNSSFCVNDAKGVAQVDDGDDDEAAIDKRLIFDILRVSNPPNRTATHRRN